jgi:hypothetical protein
MSENVCCPFLNVIPCGDTDEHCHFVCDFYYATMHHLSDLDIMDNEFVKSNCMSDSVKCQFYPKGE